MSADYKVTVNVMLAYNECVTYDFNFQIVILTTRYMASTFETGPSKMEMNNKLSSISL